MADRAKLFKNGGSQAVRLPKGYRFEGQDEVAVSRRPPRDPRAVLPGLDHRVSGARGGSSRLPPPV